MRYILKKTSFSPSLCFNTEFFPTASILKRGGYFFTFPSHVFFPTALIFPSSLPNLIVFPNRLYKLERQLYSPLEYLFICPNCRNPPVIEDSADHSTRDSTKCHRTFVTTITRMQFCGSV